LGPVAGGQPGFGCRPLRKGWRTRSRCSSAPTTSSASSWTGRTESVCCDQAAAPQRACVVHARAHALPVVGETWRLEELPPCTGAVSATAFPSLSPTPPPPPSPLSLSLSLPPSLPSLPLFVSLPLSLSPSLPLSLSPSLPLSLSPSLPPSLTPSASLPFLLPLSPLRAKQGSSRPALGCNSRSLGRDVRGGALRSVSRSADVYQQTPAMCLHVRVYIYSNT
jgi:hypothetical protein